MLRETPYAKEIRPHAEINGGRIERLEIKSSGEEEIRFSWWKDGRLIPRPLDLPEHELSSLFRKAIENGIFTDGLLQELRAILA